MVSVCPVYSLCMYMSLLTGVIMAVSWLMMVCMLCVAVEAMNSTTTMCSVSLFWFVEFVNMSLLL